MYIKVKILNPKNFKDVKICGITFKNHNGYLDTEHAIISGFGINSNSVIQSLKELCNDKARALLNLNDVYVFGTISKSMIFHDVRFEIEEVE